MNNYSKCRGFTMIKDPIYNYINVPDDLLPFLNYKLFQRLRYIKQLGLAYFVYPSATHTRFEHSLGVMHLAGRLFEKLWNTIDEKLDTPYGYWKCKMMVQLAALYHDIGHVAFSHLADKWMPKDSLQHEQRSCKFLKTANSEIKLFNDVEIDEIQNMILGKPKNKGKMSWIYQIVNNGKNIDVDRADYLNRDAYHTGMPRFNFEYLMECMDVDNEGRIYVNPKGETERLDMAYTRSKLFKVVYEHSKVIEYEHMAMKAIKERVHFKEEESAKYTDFHMLGLIYDHPSYQMIMCRGKK
jgi:HD superfamily phosphohydrolase